MIWHTKLIRNKANLFHVAGANELFIVLLKKSTGLTMMSNFNRKRLHIIFFFATNFCFLKEREKIIHFNCLWLWIENVFIEIIFACICQHNWTSFKKNGFCGHNKINLNKVNLWTMCSKLYWNQRFIYEITNFTHKKPSV